ncbi:MAG TPA: right-handed parallel beta-helix repeat-containing protein [Dokdonella sp.]|nr:right-handed parallel beta-helix repeat-containing protein [Dokdonella sp.]
MTAVFAHHLPHRVLFTALAAGIGAAISPALCAKQADVAPHLRDDPAQRIFRSFAPARSRPHRALPAAVLPVTNCANDGPGSLRAAVAAANDNDEIDLSQLACSRITLTTGGIEVDADNLTLSGPGQDKLTIDGNHYDRLLVHPGSGALTVQGLTIQNGWNRASGFDVAGGGCIASAAFLYVRDSTVRNCYAGGEGSYGGAIYAYAVTLDHSTVSGNVAKGIHEDSSTAAFGGAIFTYVLDLTASTVSGNRAEHQVRPGRSSYDIGGAIVAVVGGNIRSSTIDTNYSEGRAGGVASFNPLLVSNSTISSNVAADGVGGGVFMRWPSVLVATNSTIAANRASVGSGIWIAADGTELHSTIVYGNTGSPGNANIGGMDPLANAPLTIGGSNNLIGAAEPAIALPPDTRTGNPLLGPLRPNGGPTRTHALGVGSPAIDAGSNVASLEFDQRGANFPRVFGAAADIGAYERGPTLAAPTNVPTLSARVALLLAGLLGAVAAARLRAPSRRLAAARSALKSPHGDRR